MKFTAFGKQVFLALLVVAVGAVLTMETWQVRSLCQLEIKVDLIMQHLSLHLADK